MKFLHSDSLTSQLSNEMIKIKTEENNLGKYYCKANVFKINVNSQVYKLHPPQKKVTLFTRRGTQPSFTAKDVKN